MFVAFIYPIISQLHIFLYCDQMVMIKEKKSWKWPCRILIGIIRYKIQLFVLHLSTLYLRGNRLMCGCGCGYGYGFECSYIQHQITTTPTPTPPSPTPSRTWLVESVTGTTPDWLTCQFERMWLSMRKLIYLLNICSFHLWPDAK
jgi:hypothetical protein